MNANKPGAKQYYDTEIDELSALIDLVVDDQMQMREKLGSQCAFLTDQFDELAAVARARHRKQRGFRDACVSLMYRKLDKELLRRTFQLWLSVFLNENEEDSADGRGATSYFGARARSGATRSGARSWQASNKKSQQRQNQSKRDVTSYGDTRDGTRGESSGYYQNDPGGYSMSPRG